MALSDHSEKFPMFVAVYKAASFRKAATQLNMTQPPLSHAIKVLESEIGQPLFTRSQKGVQPTASGQILFEYCSKYLYELEKLEQNLRSSENAMLGKLTIGTYDSIARYFWPDILKRSKEHFPELDLVLFSGRTQPIFDLLKERSVDYAIMVEPPQSREIASNPLYSDTYGLFQATNMTLSEEEKILIYVSQASAGQKETLDDWISKNHLNSLHSFQLDSFEVCREFIKKGLGYGILPNRVASEDLAKKTMAHSRIKGIKTKGFGKHSIYSCYRKDNPYLPRILQFHKIVREIVS